jgi:hypothetical protein
LYRAQRIADITEEYIKTAAVVDSRSGGKYMAYLNQIQDLRSAYRTVRDGLTFGVRANAADDGERITRFLEALLEDNGYVITSRNPQYSLVVRLTVTEEAYDTGMFVRPGIVIRLERNGKSLFSYSQNYDRYGHRSRDGAYNRAYIAIEKDLEENFMTKLAAMIGG